MAYESISQTMTFDQQLKSVFNWNIEAFKRFMIALQHAQSREGTLLFDMAKNGLQANLHMGKLLSQMAFVPDDEQSAEWDAATHENKFVQNLEKRQSNTPVPDTIPANVKERDLKELEYIYNLKEQTQAEKAIEKINPNWYQEFLAKERKVLDGNTTETNGTDKERLPDSEIRGSEGSD